MKSRYSTKQVPPRGFLSAGQYSISRAIGKYKRAAHTIVYIQYFIVFTIDSASSPFEIFSISKYKNTMKYADNAP
jgi:hypothetical protein